MIGSTQVKLLTSGNGNEGLKEIRYQQGGSGEDICHLIVSKYSMFSSSFPLFPKLVLKLNRGRLMHSTFYLGEDTVRQTARLISEETRTDS